MSNTDNIMDKSQIEAFVNESVSKQFALFSAEWKKSLADTIDQIMTRNLASSSVPPGTSSLEPAISNSSDHMSEEELDELGVGESHTKICKAAAPSKVKSARVESSGESDLSESYTEPDRKKRRKRSVSSSSDDFTEDERRKSKLYRKRTPLFLQELKPPDFDKDSMSPVEYLEQLEEYFETQKITDDHMRMTCVRHGYKKINDESIFKPIKKYSEFEKLFLKTFWSALDRKDYKKSLFTEIYKSDIKDESLSNFCKRQILKAKKYFPEMEFKKIRSKIADLVPSQIALTIMIQKPKSEEKLIFMLREIERNKSLSRDLRKVEAPEPEQMKIETKCETEPNEQKQKPYYNNKNYNNGKNNFFKKQNLHQVNAVQTDQPATAQQNSQSQSNNHNKFQNSRPFFGRGRGRGKWTPRPRYFNNQQQHHNGKQNYQGNNDFVRNTVRTELEKVLDQKLALFRKVSEAPPPKIGGTSTAENCKDEKPSVATEN